MGSAAWAVDTPKRPTPTAQKINASKILRVLLGVFMLLMDSRLTCGRGISPQESVGSDDIDSYILAG